MPAASMSAGSISAGSSPVKSRFPWLRAAIGVAGFFALLIFDQRLYFLFLAGDKASLERHSLYQLFRQAGYWPVWLAVAAAVGFHDAWRRARAVPDPRPRERTLPILLGPGAAGLAAELLKVVLRRERPDAEGLAHFRPWSVETFSGSGLGLPSSHAAVAFGAAFAIARVFPGSGPVVFVLACGCAVTRLMAGAHFATDVYLAAILAYGIVGLEFRLWFGRGT